MIHSSWFSGGGYLGEACFYAGKKSSHEMGCTKAVMLGLAFCVLLCLLGDVYGAPSNLQAMHGGGKSESSELSDAWCMFGRCRPGRGFDEVRQTRNCGSRHWPLTESEPHCTLHSKYKLFENFQGLYFGVRTMAKRNKLLLLKDSIKWYKA